MEDLFAPTIRVRHVCLNCRHEAVRESKGLTVDLIYPRKPLSNEPFMPTDFGSVLAASLVREAINKSPCRVCGNANANIQSKRNLPPTRNLPQVISINASILTADQMALWLDEANASARARKVSVHQTASKQLYLPTKIAVESSGASGEKAIVKELRQGVDAPVGTAVYRLKVSAGDNRTVSKVTRRFAYIRPLFYEQSLVIQIQAPKDPAHLVSVVRVPTDVESSSEDATWFLYNDFLVRAVPQEEALSFPASTWKVPAILYFERIDRQMIDVESIPWTLDTKILTQDICISKKRDPQYVRHRPFAPEEIPQKGELLSIDAEFVSLNPEELEISSNGTRSLVRPTTLSLARVSVLRGQGPNEGQPCIDDHIATHDRIFDYLTQFSGIVDGDLDPARSKHTVVPQKLAYKKLRLLVDLGCTFIGHGLKKDFRIINVYVPPNQVIDTVDLFSSASHARKLSLRFLSWFLLKEAIQGDKLSCGASGNGSGHGSVGAGRGEEEETVPGHDSIEDARAALHLYKIYETFVESGRFEDVMEDLYEEGKRLNWRPPPSTAATAGVVANNVATAAAVIMGGASASS